VFLPARDHPAAATSNTVPAEATVGRAYIVGHRTADTLLIRYIDDASNLLFPRDTVHTTTPGVGWTSLIPSPTSPRSDWFAAPFRSRYAAVGGAALRCDQLWVAWGAARDYCIESCLPGQTPTKTKTGYAQPHIQLAVLNASSFTLKSEGVISNSAFAFAFPDLDVSYEADVAITYAYGGGIKNPQPGIGIPTGKPEYYRTSAATALLGGQGDHTTVHRDYPNGNRFQRRDIRVQNRHSGSIRPLAVHTIRPPPLSAATRVCHGLAVPPRNLARTAQEPCHNRDDTIRGSSQKLERPPRVHVPGRVAFPRVAFSHLKHRTVGVVKRATTTRDPPGYEAHSGRLRVGARRSERPQ